ncbi:MAG: Gfo/Idh/MocA family oxidoreductase [Clostridiales Family XIII bacterium]|jgi:predicted dehydrogenase|nr:Gfo/Idh/MocA family oxidoreductase [Clostridiales Family XIII bacterium]
MAKELKYGMVGGSMHAFIGEVHRKAIAYDTRAELVCGSFSSDAARNAETAAVYGLPPERTYRDYIRMAQEESARPDGIDFVVIATPNDTHFAIAVEFLKAGIHVVCEKPLCLSVDEGEELLRLTREKDLIFGVTYTYTGYTMIKVAKDMIAGGKLGDIVAINAEYVQDWLIDEVADVKPGGAARARSGGISAWRTDPHFAGIANSVGDIGTHMENAVRYITGLEIKRLLATTDKYGHALELNANMIVEYENGVRGAYWCSQIAAGRLNGLILRIYGNAGSLEWEQHFPDYLKYTPKGQAAQTLSRGCGYISEAAGGVSRLPAGHPEGLYVAFANIYRNIISTIIKKKGGESPGSADLDFPDVSDGLSGMKFVHAVVESAASDSCWVSIR